MKRFPVLLTLVCAAAFAVLCGLGTWQLQRLAWKTDLLARIEAARTAPVVPLGEAVRRPSEGIGFARVSTTCMRDLGSTVVYGLRDGQIAWRALTQCETPEGRLLVDRGVATASLGSVKEPELDLPAAGALVGVLRPISPEVRRAAADRGVSCPFRTARGCLDLFLSVEAEAPAAAGLRPDPLPPPLTNNHLGYAITWFGLAAALLGVYAALLRKRLKP